MPVAIEPIIPNEELRQLLAECDMLFSDLGAAGSRRFFGCVRSGYLVGAVALEPYGNVGLLRSLAVEPGFRGEGLGRALVSFVEEEAMRMNIRSLYLLTTTAAAFFAQLGYQRAERGEAPAPIRMSSQFSVLCPSNAHLMVKHLGVPERPRSLS